MRSITYTLAGLFFLSLLFVGTSYATDNAMGCDSFAAAANLLGTDLRTSTDQYIGNIDDFAINPSTRQIDSVLVNHVNGAGAMVVAIPFDSISRMGQDLVYDPPTGTYGVGSKVYWDYGQLPPMKEGDMKFSALLGGNDTAFSWPGLCSGMAEHTGISQGTFGKASYGSYGLMPYWEAR